MKWNVLCRSPYRCYHQQIVVAEHVATVGSENDIDTGAVVDNERDKLRVADIDSDVLISRRTVKHFTWIL